MQNDNNNVKKFDKKEYNKQYMKNKYTTYTYNTMIDSESYNEIEKYRMLNGLTKSEFVKQCIDYFLANH